ncbi:MAG TPA: winged helix-turn-helix domain-containing protein [Steroidobacteraceae bacterium]|jgi:DNA-binding winged helix-turn-helix (wHTH) protein|nr:winged helix-turn-helix domain-containing protein [Steroidobacteraceae bacterium]
MKYAVGDLFIDTGRQSVSRSDVRIALPKLSYDLFLVLIRAAPNVVSLDEMMHGVWAGLVVSPETVSKRVMLLRDALDEDPRAPRYIAGLRGRGYQIIAVVTEVANVIADPTDGEGGSPTFLPEESRAIPAEQVLQTGMRVHNSFLAAHKFNHLPSMPILLLASAALVLGAVGAWHLWSEARASVGNVDVTPNVFAGTWFGKLETCSPTTSYSGPFAVAISNTESGLLHLVYYGYGSDGAINLTGSYDLRAMGSTANSVSPAGIKYILKNQELSVSYLEICQHGVLRRQNLKVRS